MYNKFEFAIASKYLRNRRGFVFFISTLARIGIALGVAALIIVMSVMKGFHTTIASKMIGWGGDIKISSYDQNFTEYNDIIDKIKDIKSVKLSYPVIEGQVMIIAASNNSGGLVKAMRDTDVLNKSIIKDNIISGSLDNFNDNNVLIGSDLAESLGVYSGDQLNLISPKGVSSVIGFIPRMKTFNIVGIFKSGMYGYDSSTIIMPFDIAQIYFKMKDKAENIEIEIDDPYSSHKISKEILKIIGPNYRIEDWQITNATFFNVLKTERVVMFVILTLIIIIAAFNIVSSLRILVTDKKKDISTLRAMGASRQSIKNIFILCALSIGLKGVVAGIALGLSVTFFIDDIRKFLETLTGNKIFDPVIYYLSALPVEIDYGQIAIISVMAVILSLAASIYPAYLAAKINPAEGLRYD